MNNRDKILRVIEIIADSLNSHLPYCKPFEYTEEDRKEDTPEFHQTCVKEYVEALKHLTDML